MQTQSVRRCKSQCKNDNVSTKKEAGGPSQCRARLEAGGAAERQTCFPYEGDANLHLSNNNFFRISSDVGGREYLRSSGI